MIIYNKLLSQNPKIYQWWLGLALAQLKNYNINAAKRTFKHILSLENAPINIQFFAQSEYNQLR